MNNRHLHDHDEHHRDVHGGAARAAVFGVSDGVVSNVSLVLGVAGASPGAGVVRLAGLAGLIAGAVSMAAGEYVSMQAQRELLERELDQERRALAENPVRETEELTSIYEQRGISTEAAALMAKSVMADPEIALEVHAREEIGIDPNSLGSPVIAASSSFGAFAVGAIMPLLPWFFTSGAVAVVASVILAAVTALAVGWSLATFTGRSKFRAMFRQVAIATVAAAVTFAIGSLVGAGV